MDNFVDFLVNRVMFSITGIRNQAAQHNGRCTWHFSQCKDPVRSIIAKAAPTKDGICEILAAKWAVLEVQGKTTLVEWLAGGGSGNRSQLDIARVSLLAQTFGTGVAGGDQEGTTQRWVESQGVKQAARMELGGMAQRGAGKFDVDDLFADMAKNVGRLSNPLVGLITVAEQNSVLGYKGHIMAFRLHQGGATPVKYFDPNFGEFEFDTFANFKDWFRYYFRKSHYSAFMGTLYKLRFITL